MCGRSRRCFRCCTGVKTRASDRMRAFPYLNSKSKYFHGAFKSSCHLTQLSLKKYVTPGSQLCATALPLSLSLSCCRAEQILFGDNWPHHSIHNIHAISDGLGSASFQSARVLRERTASDSDGVMIGPEGGSSIWQRFPPHPPAPPPPSIGGVGREQQHHCSRLLTSTSAPAG